MSNPVVSILIPSRDRPVQLMGAILKFKYEAPKDAAIEFVVRIDDDDRSYIRTEEDFNALGNVRIIQGPRKPLHVLNTELSAAAKGYWIWFWSDDAWIRGGSWYEQLKALPRNQSLILTESLQIDSTIYYGGAGEIFPIVPRDAWNQFPGYTEFPEPVDTGMIQLCRNASWPEKRLLGITAVHMWHWGKESGGRNSES